MQYLKTNPMSSKTFNNLYTKHCKRFYTPLGVKIEGYSDPFDLELNENNKPDCCISHFGYNLYFRTKAGLNYKKYKSWNILKREVIKKAESLGLKVEGFTIKPRRSYKYFFIG